MAARQYKSTADSKTLAGAGITTAGQTAITLSSITNLPPLTGSQTFTLVIGPDTATEEIVTVTSYGSGNVVNVTRGSDGTTAQSAHAVGTIIKHMITARDLQEPQDHINASASVHGVSGSVVGTTGSQELTNKTLGNSNNIKSGSTLTNNGTISGGTIQTPTIDNATITNSAFTAGVVSSSTLSGTITNSGTISGGTVSNVTISGTTTNSGTVSGGTISGSTVSGATLSGTTTNSGTISGGTIAGTITNTATITGGTLNPATLKQNSITVPLAFSSGTGTFSPGGTTTGTATVTFPSSRFTVTPVVVITCENAAFNMAVSSISTTGCTVTGRNIDATNASGTYTFDWIAIQQTGTAYTAGTAQ